MESLSNEELLQKVQEYREKIADYEDRVQRGESVEYGELRRTMTDLNQFKIQAKLRGLDIPNG